MVNFSNKETAKSIFIANVKGGVGKSTLSIMLARALASNLPPQNITVIDTDLQRTTTEFLLVKELAKRPGIIKERAQLMDIAYREDTDIEDRTIDSHVKRIRKKFKKVDENFSAIETRYGSGYRWNVS